MTRPAIELADVVKEYRIGAGVVRALDGVTLRIEAGCFAAITGPSGSGKSTLLHLLGALDSPGAGTVTVAGERIDGRDERWLSEFRRTRVGFVFQFFNLVPSLSAWENVAVPALLGGTPLRRAKPRARHLLDRVGLADRARHRPAELSGGQMQRVAIARALMMDPAVILADEPTGNLDSASGAAILDLLRGLADDGAAVVMVTHDGDAARGCDRVITLRDGRIAARTEESPGGEHSIRPEPEARAGRAAEHAAREDPGDSTRTLRDRSSEQVVSP
ncbi:ABC transporter ATP-binding protein [Nocardia puris]|uniref:Putative ABC transport system ATP-binding protein n=1 Tax=Nocardia puris TaxID=208602 RepID=A0A366DHJ3_9NOCA|nr:ABC transporter ATP-binding protein [Nocardia puris]MBF6213305.1 ABC transporter ATP-binding protein [Nocardia puris]MBF6369527.1 ABC transporter ATP-binding protein [Nocardia puris]MBF6462184.1 ABC transporter ATP-binding protein [Nocardia puris]RBO89491.1 putative ABC transport system ATP-binding protein [Nocardia puris]